MSSRSSFTAQSVAQPPLAALQSAAQLLQGGRYGEASNLLSALIAAHPRSAEAHYLFAAALRGLKDFATAERELRAAVALNKRLPQIHAELGLVLNDLGRPKEAERAFRAALALDRRFIPAIVPLSELLCAAERPQEAVQLTAPLVTAPGVGEDVLSVHAEALKTAGRLEDGLAAYRQAAAAFPHSAYAHHNIASTLADLGLNGEAEAAARAAVAKGFDRVETALVLGRALQRQDRFDEAERAFRQVIARAPAYAAAQTELAQLVWMRTGDIEQAAVELKAALRAVPKEPVLTLGLAQLLEFAGDLPGAYAVLERVAGADAPMEVNVAAARAAIRLDPQRALEHAKIAVATGRNDAADLAYGEALLACGRPREALALIESLRRRRPLDQHVLAYQATAWRLLDDPRYGELYAYDVLVRPSLLDTPPGWGSLAAYLADLKAALLAMHGLKAHPIGQSLRSGTQTNQRLERSEHPAIRAFFQAIEGPIGRYLDAVGRGKDPLRSRNKGGYALAGSWSVLLQPGGGRHVDHVHQKGWVSSACYIDLPPAVSAQGRQGWIKFGEPGTPTQPPLPPEHVVRPEPGMLVLFPSYMWHGTIAFSGDQPRLTIAFDLVPA